MSDVSSHNDLASLTRELENIKYALDRSAIVAITDRAGRIIYVNDKFCEISKYSREELLGQNHRLINSGFHSKDFFVEMWQTISNGKIWQGEIKNRAKDGSLYWVSTTIVPYLDENSKPERYIAIRFEITEKKLGEEKLKSYAQQLERSNRELESFASVAAHDLQEPLRKIQAFCDRIVTKEKANLSEQGQDYLRRVIEAGSRMQRLITDLLAYSRVSTRGQAFQQTDLNEVVSQALADLEVSLEEKKAQVQVDSLPTLQADPTQMRQLFQNLIGNALKFVRTDIRPLIQIRVEKNSSPEVAWKILVIDNGIGFENKYLDRIFNIFQRLHDRQSYPGTGIGLAICRRIVERHQGEITAEGKPGLGATFIVTLPERQKLSQWENT